MNKLSIPHPPEPRRTMAHQGDLIWITRRESVYIIARYPHNNDEGSGVTLISLAEGNIWTWKPLLTKESWIKTKDLSEYIGLSNTWGFAEEVTIKSPEAE